MPNRGVFVAVMLAACGGSADRSVVSIPQSSTMAPKVAAAVAPPALSNHAMVLDHLTAAETSVREWDGVEIPLPDAYRWDNVNFILVPSVISIQYGNEDDFHAILGGFVVHVANAAEPGACARVFEVWAAEWLDAFDTDYKMGRSWTAPWTANNGQLLTTMQGGDVIGKVATLAARGTYQCAYAAYPAWKSTCLVLGLAVPSRDDDQHAQAFRDRFARDVFPNVKVNTNTPPMQHAAVVWLDPAVEFSVAVKLRP